MTPIVLTGHAYGNRATLEISAESLTWRAQHGLPPIPENIATTPHDVKEARVITKRWSASGLALALASPLWMLSENAIVGTLPFGIGLALIAWRQLKPPTYLSLDLGSRELRLQLEPSSVKDARALVERIDRREPQASPPTLP